MQYAEQSGSASYPHDDNFATRMWILIQIGVCVRAPLACRKEGQKHDTQSWCLFPKDICACSSVRTLTLCGDACAHLSTVRRAGRKKSDVLPFPISKHQRAL